jgi:hypothetical protein
VKADFSLGKNSFRSLENPNFFVIPLKGVLMEQRKKAQFLICNTEKLGFLIFKFFKVVNEIS